MKDALLDPHSAKPDVIYDDIRGQLIEYSKSFKTAWVNLARMLYSVYTDKLFYGWGYEKFEHYTQRELGIKKPVAIKLLKTYIFLEQEEPEYLQESFQETVDAHLVPNCDTVNVLRLAKRKKELSRDEYAKMRDDVFKRGKDASIIRKDLTAMMKERKEVDPDEEREKRNKQSIRKFLHAISSFKKDMEALKLIPEDLVEEADQLMNKLEVEIK